MIDMIIKYTIYNIYQFYNDEMSCEKESINSEKINFKNSNDIFDNLIENFY